VIQEAYVEVSERGYRSSGRKIGFTNRAMWEQFKVSQPVWAHMYPQTVHFAKGGYRVPGTQSRKTPST
jgi:2-keto-4-pentenoate hydratase